MPFAVEDLRVLCHTRNATRTFGQLSGAEWVLKAPVMPPNPNYKIKAHVTTMQIPNSFEHVGPRQLNDTLVVVKRHLDTGDTWEKAVARGDYVRVVLETRDGHITNVRDYFESLSTLEKGINNGLIAAHKAKISWRGTPYAPQLRIDKKGYPVLWSREMYQGSTAAKVERGLDEEDTEAVSDQMEVSYQEILHPQKFKENGNYYWTQDKATAHDAPFFLVEWGGGIDSLYPPGIGFVVRGNSLDPSLKAYSWVEPPDTPEYEDINDFEYYMCIAYPGLQEYIPTVDETYSNLAPPAVGERPRLMKLPLIEDNKRLDLWEYVYNMGLKEATLVQEGWPKIHPGNISNDRFDPSLHLSDDTKDILDGGRFFQHPQYGERFKRFYFQEFMALYASVLRPGKAPCRYDETNAAQDTRVALELAQGQRNGANDTYRYPLTAFAGGRDAVNDYNNTREQMTYEYKLVTQYDLLRDPGLSAAFGPRDAGLAQLIGYTRFVRTPPVNVPANINTPPQADGSIIVPEDVSLLPEGVAMGGTWSDGVVAQAPTDFSGVRYIKVFTSMNVNAVDQDLDTAKLIAICPTVGGNAVESNYLVGALQQSQTFTLSDTKIDRIRFDLRDDFNRPVEMWRDWWIDVTFSFEEPYSVDHYQGISNLVNIGTRFTTEGYDFDSYSTVTRDLGDELDRLASAEQRNRRKNTDLGTKRKHGPGGY